MCTEVWTLQKNGVNISTIYCYLFKLVNLWARKHRVVQNLKSEYLNGISTISIPHSSQGFWTFKGSTVPFSFSSFFFLRFGRFLPDGFSLIWAGSGISDLSQLYRAGFDSRNSQKADRISRFWQNRKAGIESTVFKLGSDPLARRTLMQFLLPLSAAICNKR